MTAYRFRTADVFTTELFGGNQLAVFLDGQGLSKETMQRIAREFNLSETVFVFPPQDSSCSHGLRIFTPAEELPFAGHPTLGAAVILAQEHARGDGKISSELVLEEGVGPIRVSVERRSEGWFSELTVAKAPEFGPPPPSSDVLEALLSLDRGDIAGDSLRPLAVSCGVPFLFVPLLSQEAVSRARLRRDLWESELRQTWAPNLYIFTMKPDSDKVDIHARMFAPILGVEEDPATGSAAAALGGYLATHNVVGNGRTFTIAQGVEMGRPSRLLLTVAPGTSGMLTIRVGGYSVSVSEGIFHLPEA